MVIGASCSRTMMALRRNASLEGLPGELALTPMPLQPEFLTKRATTSGRFASMTHVQATKRVDKDLEQLRGITVLKVDEGKEKLMIICKAYNTKACQRA